MEERIDFWEYVFSDNLSLVCCHVTLVQRHRRGVYSSNNLKTWKCQEQLLIRGESAYTEEDGTRRMKKKDLLNNEEDEQDSSWHLGGRDQWHISLSCFDVRFTVNGSKSWWRNMVFFWSSFPLMWTQEQLVLQGESVRNNKRLSRRWREKDL